MNRWRAAALMIVAGFVGSAMFHVLMTYERPAMAQEATPGVLELKATRFVLVDEQGKRRAVLGEFEAEIPAGVDPEPIGMMVGLAIYSPEGRPTLQIGRRVSGGPSSRIMLYEPGGYANVGVGDDGPGMGLFCPAERLRFGMGWLKAGNGGITICDLQGRERLSLGAPENGGISVHVKNEAGVDLFSAP